MHILIEKIKLNFQLERENFVLWIPIFVAIGILMYFSLPYEPYQIFITHCLIVILIALTFIKYFKNFKIMISILILISSGFAVSQYHTNNNQNVFIKKSHYYGKLIGKINYIVHKEKFLQLIVSDISSTNYKNEKINKIKITVRTKIYKNFEIGDKISFSAYLHPPQVPVALYSYDFAKLSFFSGISGVGFATSDINLLYKPTKKMFFESLLNFRERLYQKFKMNMKTQEAEIAAAFIIGKRDGINKNVLQNFRNSGTAHLLAISGLHLSLVSLIFFQLIRYVILASEFLTLQYDVKKIAAIFAIFFSYCYLIIAGSSISAQRAFIMSVFFFFATVVDRKIHLIRITMLAATIILYLEPVSIFNPSFQMSFSAVIVLASNLIKNNVTIIPSVGIFNKIHKLFLYIKTIILSSFLASLATTPYTIYTFNYFSVSGTIANLFAIPLATMFIIPLGIIASILDSLWIFSWVSKPVYFAMEISINVLIYMIKQVSNIPFSYYNIHVFSSEGLLFVTLGILILCLFKTQLKKIGIVFIIIGFLIGLSYKTADIWINQKTVAIKGNDENLYFLGLKKPRINFITSTWLKQNAQSKMLFARNSIIKEIAKEVFLFDGKKKIIFDYSIFGMSENYINYKDSYVICFSEQNFSSFCKIKYQDLLDNGAYFIWFNPYKIKYTKSDRKWHKN